MVTSEFLPIGLLGPMAHDLRVSEGRAGLMVTAPGLVAAVAAPLLTSIAGRIDRRILLLILTGLIMLSDLVVASAPGLIPVLAGRMLLGMALGGFWAFAAAVGRKLVPDAWGNRATALILGGISVGTVAGVPIGTMIGDLVGWRFAFLAIAALGALLLLAQFVLLPPVPGNEGTNIGTLLAITRVPAVRVGYAAAALVAGGHFAAYTYLEPFLANHGWNGGSGLTALLAVYGVSGIAGTWAGERLATRTVATSFILVALVIAGSIRLAALAGDHGWAITLAIILWGAGFGALPVCVQIWTFEAATDQFETGSALMVTVFQLAVALGALLGGRLVDGIGIGAAFSAGAALACLAAVILVIHQRRHPRRRAQAAPASPSQRPDMLAHSIHRQEP